MLNYIWKDRRICLYVKEVSLSLYDVACVGLVFCMLKAMFMKVYSGYVTKSTHLADRK